jgi:hypothetical protein
VIAATGETRAVVRRAVDWLFRDRRTGEIVVAQFPNLALWLFLATVVVRRLVDEDSSAYPWLRGLGLAFLARWALDELVRGVNPWRRFLGVVGCVIVAAGVVRWLV